MPRMKLSDEEAATIEALRRDEAKYNVGFNRGIEAAGWIMDEVVRGDTTPHEAVVKILELKKVIRP